jgi:hypothetical protein
MTAKTKNNGTRHFLTEEGLEVATVHYQGGWVCRKLWADEVEIKRYATLETAENHARLHAACMS